MDLVTGATGHIGNVLVRELLNRGKKVRAMFLPGEDLTPLKDMDVEIVEGDVLDSQTLEKAFQGIENVYHLAGIISIMPGNNELLKLVNILGTRVNMIHAARSTNIRRLTYTSSIHAIRHMPHGVTIDEHVPFDPEHVLGLYDQSKAQASLEVLNAINAGLDAVIVCPTGVIGPYDYRRSEIGQIILGCVQKLPQVYIDGAYDFVDVRDVALGMIATEKGGRGETYILSGEQVTVRRMLETVWKYTGKRFPPVRVPLRLARFFTVFTPLYYRLFHLKPRLTPYSLETLLSNSQISHDKAQQELGYRPRPFATSIADSVKWFIENMHLFKTTPSSLK